MMEKEHEVYFLQQIEGSRLLPPFEKVFFLGQQTCSLRATRYSLLFEAVFSWGSKTALNDVDLENKYSVEDSHRYCKTTRESK